MIAGTTDTVLDAEAFAGLVGVDPAALPASCRAALADADLRYGVLTGADREAQLLTALRGGEATELRPSGPHRAADWERGWNENLRAYESAGYAREQLIPRYNKYDVLRLAGDYVRVPHGRFEYAVYDALRHYCFLRWFRDCTAVTEFGCGTGTSLLLLSEILPHLELTGCDWAPSSQAIVEKLAVRTGRPIAARRFDMFQPDPGLRLANGTGVLTSAAMEQLGAGHGAFVDYLLRSGPQVCVHIEPIYELYDEDLLFDDVARRYHRHRNYLLGFLPRIRELAASGHVELLAEHRTGFGSFYHEGYSLVVWRPADAAGGGR